jgi:hypothetical protein
MRPACRTGRDERRIKCRRIKAWLHEAITSRFGPDADWVQHHIAGCPRCQKRFIYTGKVNLALSLLKSQPHNVDLLKRANTQAIAVLKHSLQAATKAQKLKSILPEPKLSERCKVYNRSIGNVAACITILLFAKIGVFSFMDNFQTRGQEVIKQYYISQVGEDLANEIFTI